MQPCAASVARCAGIQAGCAQRQQHAAGGRRAVERHKPRTGRLRCQRCAHGIGEQRAALMQAANQHHIKLQQLQLQLANYAQRQRCQLPAGPSNALARNGVTLQRNLKDVRRVLGEFVPLTYRDVRAGLQRYGFPG